MTVIHQWLVDSTHKDQWHGALIVLFLYATKWHFPFQCRNLTTDTEVGDDEWNDDTSGIVGGYKPVKQKTKPAGGVYEEEGSWIKAELVLVESTDEVFLHFEGPEYGQSQ